MVQKQHPVLLFDGVCNLCNAVVQFVLRHDSKKEIKFTSLQSGFGQDLLAEMKRSSDHFDSFIYYEKEVPYERSQAFFKLMAYLGGVFQILLIFKIIPRSIADWIYDRIASSRYFIFGKRDECYTPTPELKSRFLE